MKGFPLGTITLCISTSSISKTLQRAYGIHKDDADKIQQYCHSFRQSDDDGYGHIVNLSYVHDLFRLFVGEDSEDDESLPLPPEDISNFNYYSDHFLKYYNNSTRESVLKLLQAICDIEDSGIAVQLERYW